MISTTTILFLLFLFLRFSTCVCLSFGGTIQRPPPPPAPAIATLLVQNSTRARKHDSDQQKDDNARASFSANEPRASRDPLIPSPYTAELPHRESAVFRETAVIRDLSDGPPLWRRLESSGEQEDADDPMPDAAPLPEMPRVASPAPGPSAGPGRQNPASPVENGRPAPPLHARAWQSTMMLLRSPQRTEPRLRLPGSLSPRVPGQASLWLSPVSSPDPSDAGRADSPKSTWAV